MDYYTAVIIATVVGFSALAAALLIPVWRFLKREEEAGEQWTRQIQDAPPPSQPNGTAHHEALDNSDTAQ